MQERSELFMIPVFNYKQRTFATVYVAAIMLMPVYYSYLNKA